MAIIRYHSIREVSGSVEMVLISFSELPKPSRTRGTSKKPVFQNQNIYRTNIKKNNYVTEVWYPELKKNMKVHGTPWKFSKTPAKIKRAPKLGEHNEELLSNLGYTNKEIKNLEDDKVI